MFDKCHAKVHFRLWFTFVTSTTHRPTTPTKRKRVRVTKKTPLVSWKLKLQSCIRIVDYWKS